MLTHKEYPEFKSAKCISGCEIHGYAGNRYHYRNGFAGVREYDDFDYIAWFNSGQDG